ALLMKIFLFVVMAVFSLSTKASDCSHKKDTFKCVKYVRNYDADTITFNIPGIHPLLGEKISIRVRDVDAPEKHGKLPCEKEVSRNGQKLVQSLLRSAKSIELTDVGRDKYFRILAHVKFDGVDLKEILLKNNLAYP